MPRAKNLKNPKAYWKEQWRIMKERGEDEKQLERAKARRAYDKAGINRKGKDIDHVKALAEGGKSTKGNLRLRDRSENQADNGHRKGEKPGVKRTNKVYRSK
jgi:hypothetical protein